MFARSSCGRKPEKTSCLTASFFFREELKTSQDEIDRVKDEYIKISEGTERMKEEINRQYQTKIEENVQEVGEHYFVTNNF